MNDKSRPSFYFLLFGKERGQAYLAVALVLKEGGRKLKSMGKGREGFRSLLSTTRRD